MKKTPHNWDVTEDIDTCDHCKLQRRTVAQALKGGDLMVRKRVYFVGGIWKTLDIQSAKYCKT